MKGWVKQGAPGAWRRTGAYLTRRTPTQEPTRTKNCEEKKPTLFVHCSFTVMTFHLIIFLVPANRILLSFDKTPAIEHHSCT